MVQTSSERYGTVLVKPLGVIWQMYPAHTHPSTTLHLDDLRRNFLLNPRQGLKIHACRKLPVTRGDDRELLHLAVYYSLIRRLPSLDGLRHSRWKSMLRGHGYGVEFTRATGDFGVDLIATRDGVRTAVQCKRQARAVNGSAIQQVVGGAPVHGCTKTMVVCNHRYTRAAELLAAVHDCLLVDRGRLARLARRPTV